MAMQLIFLPGLCATPLPSFGVANDRFVINGTQPVSLRAGSIHYSRVHPELWDDRLSRLRALGLNAVTTYVPWNFHEAEPGAFDFSSPARDLPRFLRLAQRHRLHVLLRAGPYMCGEWDFGGLPSWLLSNGTLKLRTHAEPYLSHVDRYWRRLLAVARPLLFEHGGPVAMVQVENEYGSYGDVSLHSSDEAYMRHLVSLARESLGPNVLLFTTDGGSADYMRRGSLPGDAVLTVGDGCSDPASTWAAQKGFNPPGASPFLCAELYPGWLTHWGEPMANTSAASAASSLDAVLSAAGGSGSASLYMAHGGTSFGWWAGANGAGGASYQPDITSYDYDAPLSEGGEHGFGSDGMDKYEAIAAVLRAHRPAHESPPPPEPPLRPRAALGTVSMDSTARLLEMAETIAPEAALSGSKTPPAGVETIGCYGGGFVLLEATLSEGLERGGLLTLPKVQDRALVFAARPPPADAKRREGSGVGEGFGEATTTGGGAGVAVGHKANHDAKEDDPTYLGTISRTDKAGGGVSLPPLGSGARLLLLLELMGRINFSHGMDDARFGLLGGVLVGGSPLAPDKASWSARCMPMSEEQLQRLRWSPLIPRRDGPAFYRGTFSSSAAGVDTFLELPGFTKGAAWVNGFHLGRYWNPRGPQLTLYVPGPVVRAGNGTNELVVLELHNASKNASVELRGEPVWGVPPSKAKRSV
jgi:beta-galactosidase